MVRNYYLLGGVKENFPDFILENNSGYCDLWAKYISSANINSKKSIIITLSGASSIGKSSFCLELAHALGIRNIVITDIIRMVLRSNNAKSKNKALFLPSYDCWKAYSKVYDKKAHIKGFKDQCSEVLPYILDVINEARDYGKITIIEGLHIIPSMIPKEILSMANFIPIVIDVPKDQKHKELFEKRKHSTYLNKSYLESEDKPTFEWFRTLGDFFLEESKSDFVHLVSNEDPRKSVESIFRIVFDRVERILEE